MQQRQTFSGPLLSPFAVFVLQAVFFAPAVALATTFVLPTVAWVLFALAVLNFAVGQSLANGDYPHAVFGLHNTVTLARANLVCLLFGSLFAGDVVSPWLVFGVGSLALALDGVDGWLARRAGLQSEFGARFDVETDSALAAILAIWLLVSGTTGWEILLLGFTRYAFVLAGWVVPRLRAELPPAFRRKAICVVQIGALIVLTLPFLPNSLVLTFSITASLALVYSFAVDLRWLLSRKT
ncbi:MAG: CDP-alcohol phosphatidyltransferase family protein [Pseudomonadota bacterium]